MPNVAEPALSMLVSVFHTLVRGLRSGHSALFYRLFGSDVKRKEKFTVAVEGNIGSGKTSLLRYFESVPGVEAIMEPVAQWRDIDGHNALALMYKDPARWSLCLQTFVQLTMLEIHTRRQCKPVKLMERSIFSAKYCFVENLHRSKVMTDIEYIVLSRWFDWIIRNQDCDVDLIVYLRTDPETVNQRIKNRCRREEQTIPMEYLQALHDLHEDWLIHKTHCSLPAPVLVLDANAGLEDMVKQYELHKQDILFGHAS